jgi:hypothetical protein
VHKKSYNLRRIHALTLSIDKHRLVDMDLPLGELEALHCGCGRRNRCQSPEEDIELSH